MKLSHATILLGSAALLGACANQTTNKQIYLPDGQAGFAIECSGSHISWNECDEEAGKICGPYGYKVIEKHGDKGYTTENLGVTGQGHFGHGHTTFTRAMTVACGTGRFGAPSSTVPLK